MGRDGRGGQLGWCREWRDGESIFSRMMGQGGKLE
jgi:hypothetical protein